MRHVEADLKFPSPCLLLPQQEQGRHWCHRQDEELGHVAFHHQPSHRNPGIWLYGSKLCMDSCDRLCFQIAIRHESMGYRGSQFNSISYMQVFARTVEASFQKLVKNQRTYESQFVFWHEGGINILPRQANTISYWQCRANSIASQHLHMQLECLQSWRFCKMGRDLEHRLAMDRVNICIAAKSGKRQSWKGSKEISHHMVFAGETSTLLKRRAVT